jgi:hypothetical protein
MAGRSPRTIGDWNDFVIIIMALPWEDEKIIAAFERAFEGALDSLSKSKEIHFGLQETLTFTRLDFTRVGLFV